MGDFLYACIQLIHNVGAAAVVGSPAVLWWLAHVNRVNVESDHSAAIWQVPNKLVWLTVVAWATQIASGAGFGATTYYLKHALPELTGIGFAAIAIKVVCALICLLLALLYLRNASRWSTFMQIRVWQTLFVLGLTALMSAAFLRWYG